MGMIGVDVVLYILFCIRFAKIVDLLKGDATQQITKHKWRAFLLQFVCVIVSMLSCSIDGFVHYIYADKEYELVPLYICDTICISICNVMMLKESQQAIIRKCNALVARICFRRVDVAQEMATNLGIVIGNANVAPTTPNDSSQTTNIQMTVSPSHVQIGQHSASQVSVSDLNHS